MQERIEELEIRYTLQQDLLQQLSDVVAKQGTELARLRSEMDELRRPQRNEPLPFDPNERPPHY
jgi:uncharacterized coiled-coil protein SlyX